MKQKLYYVLPFAAVPTLMLLAKFANDLGLKEGTFYLYSALLILFSAITAYFSPTQKNFDYLLTATAPFAHFFCMFIVGYLDRDGDIDSHSIRPLRLARSLGRSGYA